MIYYCVVLGKIVIEYILQLRLSCSISLKPLFGIAIKKLQYLSGIDSLFLKIQNWNIRKTLQFRVTWSGLHVPKTEF